MVRRSEGQRSEVTTSVGQHPDEGLQQAHVDPLATGEAAPPGALLVHFILLAQGGGARERGGGAREGWGEATSRGSGVTRVHAQPTELI